MKWFEIIGSILWYPSTIIGILGGVSYTLYNNPDANTTLGALQLIYGCMCLFYNPFLKSEDPTFVAIAIPILLSTWIVMIDHPIAYGIYAVCLCVWFYGLGLSQIEMPWTKNWTLAD